MSGSLGNGYEPRKGEENIDMFFDFEYPQEESSKSPKSPKSSSSTTKSQETTSRGGIRVSLACLPCRSRHVKCGAEMPACNRCLQDDKPCFYAKSRRGMRDRSSSKKKASQRDRGSRSPTFNNNNYSQNTNSSGYSNNNMFGNSTNDAYTNGSSSSRGSPSSSSASGPATSRQLIDLFYTYFYKAHPFVLPRFYFFTRLEADSQSLTHLHTVMQYIGSLYSPSISSSSYRTAALATLDLPSLPPTGFSVQTLLLTAIALHCEDEFTLARAVLDRAVFLAVELRMNCKEFALLETDPVLAESWRRTYWGLYTTDSTFAGIRRAPSFILYNTDSTVDLPCENRDYESGDIPRHPHTLPTYDTRDLLDEPITFSSFTYLIDLCRIAGTLLKTLSLPREEMEEEVADCGALLGCWRLHLPEEKKEVLINSNSNGKDRNRNGGFEGEREGEAEVDELMFQAHALFYVCQIRLHRPLSLLPYAPLEIHTTCAPPPPSHLLPLPLSLRKNTSTSIHTTTTLQSTYAVLTLVTLPGSQPTSHSPLTICFFTTATLAALSACAYFLEGKEWERMRDRVRLGLGALKAVGRVWKVGRRTERDSKAIARGALEVKRGDVGMENTGYGGFGGGGVEEYRNVNFEGQEVQGVDGVDWEGFQNSGYVGLMNAVETQGVGFGSSFGDI
ncbi:hypothetical protein G7Y89_g5442 [Cudoniella acicularis]|uniref:Zn(2)-C6 fungal-type domain-containing protein n=1 Tax=Cudoniella acicularis TaxID=354080 RepID=A0A8H4RPL1_9HELO|nr:hypothetical protein G7Y89_g5442 [Cudoniella acicularis]